MTITELKLPVDGDLSETMIEAAMYEFRKHSSDTQYAHYVLTVSVFDAMQAVSYMVRQDREFQQINEVHISQWFQSCEWELRTKVDDETISIRSHA